MIYLYVALLVLPFSFVLFERRLSSRVAVYYSGVLGGGLWAALTLLVSDDWTLICEPLLLIGMSLIALKLNDERLFKYQPCVTQGLVAALLLFNGSLFDLGRRYLPIVRDAFDQLAHFEPYLQLNCRLTQLLLWLQGSELELARCLARTQRMFEELGEALPWVELLNLSSDACVWPLILHSAALAVVVCKGLASVVWLAARLAIYPMVILANMYALGSFFLAQL